ncbi:FUSC family protein [Cryocola sp. 340MFSha3.1]|uniref:FUSC family protein n=1 Tax=Cryocola sp. 340MFSha3.1 TaxID=1169145 RepID=UPI00039EDA79|nr:FUSC family protein [Cryocola sp. 340MFSha3.1]
MGARQIGAILADGTTALVATAAAAAACASVWWLGSLLAGGATAGVTSAAVLATVVALSLGRRTFASRTEFARSAVVLPFIGLVAGGVGWLLVVAPPVGAALFVTGMSVPIWLRRFGPRLSRLGALVALPFTAMLIAPVSPVSGQPGWITTLLVLLAGVIATVWVAIAREILRLLPGRRQEAAPADPPPSAARGAAAGSGRARLPASTRMAIQLAVALTAAFLLGWLLFPEHAMWVVLTAFLVCSGNRGRGDVVHKSALRVVGALAGTIAAVALTAAAPHASGFGGVVIIFVALFVGTWLRAYSYAFWALTVTLVLTLLQQLTGTASLTGETGMLAERMLAIVLGAALGIAASWFVLPVRSIDVLRRRLSELLTTVGAAIAVPSDDEEERTRAVAAVRASAARVEQLAPAHRARRLLRRPGRGVGRAGTSAAALPIDCIDAAAELPGALDEHLSRRGVEDADHVLTAVKRARASLASPPELTRVRAALIALAAALRASPAP